MAVGKQDRLAVKREFRRKKRAAVQLLPLQPAVLHDGVLQQIADLAADHSTDCSNTNNPPPGLRVAAVELIAHVKHAHRVVTLEEQEPVEVEQRIAERNLPRQLTSFRMDAGQVTRRRCGGSGCGGGSDCASSCNRADKRLQRVRIAVGLQAWAKRRGLREHTLHLLHGDGRDGAVTADWSASPAAATARLPRGPKPVATTSPIAHKQTQQQPAIGSSRHGCQLPSGWRVMTQGR